MLVHGETDREPRADVWSPRPTARPSVRRYRQRAPYPRVQRTAVRVDHLITSTRAEYVVIGTLVSCAYAVPVSYIVRGG